MNPLVNKVVEVEGTHNCPFFYETLLQEDHDAEESWSDEMCSMSDKECSGFMATGCPLAGGVIQIVPIPHQMDGDELCTTCGKQGAALCECCGTCGAGPDVLCNC